VNLFTGTTSSPFQLPETADYEVENPSIGGKACEGKRSCEITCFLVENIGALVLYLFFFSNVVRLSKITRSAKIKHQMMIHHSKRSQSKVQDQEDRKLEYQRKFDALLDFLGTQPKR
jgi:hypothetical protein